MKKRIADWVAVISIILLIFLLGDWYSSYYHGEAILLSGPSGRPIVITTERGLVCVAAANVPVVNSLSWSCDLRSTSPEEIEDRFLEAANESNFHLGYGTDPATGSTAVERNGHGFALITGKSISGVPGTFYALASVPFWAVVPPLGWISIARMRNKLRSRSWRRRGLCRGCGYDLRASTERCPECGMAILKREQLWRKVFEDRN
jgi:hypothetical protein